MLLDTVALRVDIWLDPWADPDGRAFQIVQSLIAFASGGLIGQGLGQGRPTYIPAIHTDFPFAAIAEEFGLMGSLGLVATVATLTLVGIRVALGARSPFRQLLAAGLATLLGLQAWIIIAGNGKLIPLTGVTLPFVSYGGSSLLSSFVALALLTTISRDEHLARFHTGVGPLKSIWTDMMGPIRRMSLGLLMAFVSLGIICGYWALVRRDALRARDDNPRLVEAEQRVHRGTIFDRQNVALVRSQADELGIQHRFYMTPTLPAVGYYSLKHGVGGIEARFDLLLRGLEGRSQRDRVTDELLHRQPKGRGIVLSLDAALHRDIAVLMGGAATVEGVKRSGAAVLLDIRSGEILALVSHPTYSPNTLDSDWDQLEADPAAPLLNRVTQGLYQPGGVLQLVVLAAALEAEKAELGAKVNNPSAAVIVDRLSLGCVRTPTGQTLTDAIIAACPTALVELGELLGAESLETTFHLWGLGAPPSFEIPTEAGDASVTDPRLAAIGQERLTVTPLQVALIAATIGNGGVVAPPHLVLKMEDGDGKWQPAPPMGQPVRVIDADLAKRLYSFLRPMTDRNILGHSSLALAGADGSFHSWFIGLAPGQAPRYAVVVLVERGGVDGLSVAEQIGQDALLAALAYTP
jgi:hypothetical protein